MHHLFKAEPQPAYPLYPVDRGWRVARYVAENTFSRTAAEAESWFTRGRDYRAKSQAASDVVPKYWLLCIAGGFYLAGAAQYISAMLFVGIFLALLFTLLSLWFVAAVLLIGLLALFTKGYSIYYRAYYRCPGCHLPMDIPVFLCGCGAEHTRLWPSLYGVLHHTCSKCDTQLPTLERNGRREIARQCPHCKRELNADIGELTNIHVPVVGGPFAGKSNFIVMATNELRRRCGETGEALVTFPDKVHEREFEASVTRLAHGRELAKTADVVPQAYTLSIRPRGSRVGKIVYLYDAAGEAYANEADTQKQIYFQYAHGVILIIDPFSIPGLRHELEERVESMRTSLRPSPLAVMGSYERMLAVLEANVGLVRNKRFPHPLSVVVTKTDALGLEDQIGAPAAAALLARDPQLGSETEAMDVLVRQFLCRYGLENFVRDVELQFEVVRFFSCSALGRMPGATDARPYVPLRVLEPLTSILGHVGVLNS